jgi:hypothetical protein
MANKHALGDSGEASNNGAKMDRSAKDMLNEALKGQWLGGRKLTFSEKCGAFAALYAGVSNLVVARAFSLAPQTVSKLSGCLENDPDHYLTEPDREPTAKHPDGVPGQRILMDHNLRRNPNRHLHYNDVAREFEALGRDEFNRRYYTERVHKRIILAKEEIRKRAAIGIKGYRRYEPERDVDADGLPNFERMSSKEIGAWKEANPEKWAELFENNPQTSLDKDSE